MAWNPQRKLRLSRNASPFSCCVAQYDTALEETFITRAIQEREAFSTRQQQPDPQVDTTPPTEPTNSPTQAADVSPMSSESSESVQVQNPVPVREANDHSALGIAGSSILTPTPIAFTSVAGSSTKGGASSSALRNIDLKDFETEQDPFENLSLRVINDREELNKVFHVTPPQSKDFLSGVSGSAQKPNHGNNTTQNSALPQYAPSNIANGLNTASLNWIACQPVPRWPLTSNTAPQNCNPALQQPHIPYAGQVSGPFVDRPNFAASGAPYTGSSNFRPLHQPTVTTRLRSAKSTPDISSLVNEHAVTAARRTPPPVSSDWSSVLDCRSRQIVSRIYSAISFTIVFLSSEARRGETQQFASHQNLFVIGSISVSLAVIIVHQLVEPPSAPSVLAPYTQKCYQQVSANGFSDARLGHTCSRNSTVVYMMCVVYFIIFFVFLATSQNKCIINNTV